MTESHLSRRGVDRQANSRKLATEAVCFDVAGSGGCDMSFGHWMEIVEGSVRLRLGPIRREDAARSVSAEAGHGLQSYEVGRYFAGTAPTVQDQEEWWDKASKHERHLHWGVYVPDGDDEWKLVGITHLELRGSDQRRAESGFVLFDRSHWRRRVASTAHLGRTLYAFEELDLLAITSNVAVANVGSNRAVAGVGYVETGRSYGIGLVDRPMDHIQYLLPNPAEEAWRYFWRRPDEEIPGEFHEGRRRALAALERAAAAVTFL
jgi:RimJ/RimL family protein N-acetyltransferase